MPDLSIRIQTKKNISQLYSSNDPIEFIPIDKQLIEYLQKNINRLTKRIKEDKEENRYIKMQEKS